MRGIFWSGPKFASVDLKGALILWSSAKAE